MHLQHPIHPVTPVARFLALNVSNRRVSGAVRLSLEMKTYPSIVCRSRRSARMSAGFRVVDMTRPTTPVCMCAVSEIQQSLPPIYERRDSKTKSEQIKSIKMKKTRGMEKGYPFQKTNR